MKRHNRLKKHTLGLAAALLVTAGMSQIALAGDSVYVNTSSLRYRTSAQIKDNNIAGNLSYGQKLERVGTSGQWTMILLNGKKYYVSSAYVTSKKTGIRRCCSDNQPDSSGSADIRRHGDRTFF